MVRRIGHIDPQSIGELVYKLQEVASLNSLLQKSRLMGLVRSMI